MKKLFIILLVLCLAAGAATVVYPYIVKDQHDFSTEWENNANNHWHSCIDEECTEISDEAAHVYGEGKETTPATEETEGVMTYKCTVCGYEKTEAIEKLPHTHKDENPKDHECDSCEATVGTHEAADDSHNCAYCGEAVSTCEENYGEGQITTSATCTNKGIKTYTCSVCGNTKTEDVEAKGHNDTDGDYKCNTCGVTVCEQHQAAEAVKENEVTATCKTAGSYESVVKCSACGEELSRETVATPKLDHTPAETSITENVTDPTSNKDGSYEVVVKCSVCGEDASRSTVTIPSFNGTDYKTSATYGSDKAGTATVTYTLKADENFTYTVDYTSNLAIKVDGTLNRYVPDTLDAINIPNLTITYVEATDSSAAYYSFAASGGTATVEKLLAYGDVPVVITGDVVINQNEKISNNGGFIVGSADLPGTVTINQADAQDGMQMWNSAYVTIENGTLTINGYDGIASSKTAIYSSGCAINIKANGKLVVNHYNNYFTGSAVLNFESDFIADKGIVCKSITSTARFIVDNGAVVKVTGNLGASAYTVHMKKLLNNCVDENAEFGYNHALFIKNGSMTITGNLRCASVQVGSMLGDGTKGTLTVNSDGDALTRDSGNAQFDFANGEVSFTSSNAKKSLIMVNNASSVVTVNVMKGCAFTADNYSWVFYLNADNNVSSFNYYEANLVTTNCANMFSASVKVNLLTDEG